MPLKIGDAPQNPLSIKEILARLEGDKDRTFSVDFATAVKDAVGRNAEAIALVEAYFQPTDKELASFGIKENFATLRACTDVGRLIVMACKRAAPGVFPEL